MVAVPVGLLSLTFIFTSTFYARSVSGNLQEESSNQVIIQFDLVQTKYWSDNVLSAFKQFLAMSTEEFCKVNLTACNLSQFRDFSPDNVIIVGAPVAKDVNVLLYFYVELPHSAAGTTKNTVVPKRVVTDIVKNSRTDLQAVLRRAADLQFELAFRVSYVNSELVLPPSDQTLNRILTPIACVMVFLLSLVIIALEIRKRLLRKMSLRIAREKNQQQRTKQNQSASAVSV